MLALSVARRHSSRDRLVRLAAIAFAKPHRRFSHAFERYALKLLSHTTIQAVADHLPVGWDSIKDLFKRNLKIRFAEPKLKKLKRLAIGEISINQPLATAYDMNEEFRHFWNQETAEAATRFLDDGCLRAEASTLSVLKKMASTFRMHRTGPLNDHRCPISTGPLEGLNNGYRDQEFFELRIYAIHKAKGAN